MLLLAAMPAMAAPPSLSPLRPPSPFSLVAARLSGTVARIEAAILLPPRFGLHDTGGPGFGKGMVALGSLGDGLRLAGGVRRFRRNRTGGDGALDMGLAMPNVPFGAVPGFGRFQKVAPTLALAYGDPNARGLTLGLEGNALLAGRPRLSSLIAEAAAAGLTTSGAGLADDRGSARIVPVVRVRLGYRF